MEMLDGNFNQVIPKKSMKIILNKSFMKHFLQR